MEFLQDILSKFNLESESVWMTQVFVVVLTTLVFSFIQKRIFFKLRNKLTITKNPWDDLLVHAAARPVSYLIWLLGILFAAEIVQRQSEAVIFAVIDPLRDIGVVTILIFFLLHLIRGAEDIFINKQSADDDQDVDKHTVQAIGKLIRISVFITGGLIMLQTLGYSISGILA
ncbi:MAG: mechanosensitive ion channel family protein, partial [Gammaproteobacteria bacterium]|nr:mechanosensitive ion channel family protein [Gammaproteobacteria bacterium]